MTDGADIAAQVAAFVHAPIPYIAEAILIAGVVWALSRTFIRDTMDALREGYRGAGTRICDAPKDCWEELRRQ